MSQTQLIRTIDVIYKRWYDRVNGNSYFAGFVVVNYGDTDERTICIPYQGGYGNQPIYEAWHLLHNVYGISEGKHTMPIRTTSGRHVTLGDGSTALLRDIDKGYHGQREIKNWLKHPHMAFGG